jgi:hypothetical protein
MPELTDVMRRLDGIEEQLKKQTDLLVNVARQQLAIDHLREELIAVRKKIDEDTDSRIKSLETIHAGCQIGQVEKSIKKIWTYFWAIISAYVIATIGWFMSGGRN